MYQTLHLFERSTTLDFSDSRVVTQKWGPVCSKRIIEKNMIENMIKKNMNKISELVLVCAADHNVFNWEIIFFINNHLQYKK